ncbi:MAG: hypothetical protein IT442_01315 [Phycisphaeraceae bacterium]|nr:hypothetical protein [Phycisphaeraceae bacterium]
MLPNREGRFKAAIGKHGVSDTGPNNLATFVCDFHLTQELAQAGAADGGQEWIPVDEDLTITGYFYLEKKDGSLNTVTIEQLQQAFGWDGRDPFWLQDTDFAAYVVQVKLAYEQFNGKVKMKVQYVNAEDWAGGGVPQADAAMRRAISARLGSKFRANAPAPKQAVAPAPAQAATQSPRKGKVSRPASPTQAAATSTTSAPSSRPAAPASGMAQAWEAFVKACPAEWPGKEVEEEWFRILGVMFPGKQPQELGDADWAKVAAEAPDQVAPF